MNKNKSIAFAAGMFGALALVGPACAGDLRAAFSDCVNKFANAHQSVSVMLQCTAAGGKLTNCTVLDAPSPANGFDKAAQCVADALPIGDKTGTLKVPIRFEASM